ncbi:MAG: hypothetical protein PVJ15_07345 [Gammaproteobacteria bacterium]|jgi:hypothetical protein
MRAYIKEWPNKTATIMTEDFQIVWTFASMEEARQVGREWQDTLLPERIEYYELSLTDYGFPSGLSESAG